MQKYYIVPALATAAIMTSMIYSLATMDPPTDGEATHADGLKIYDIQFSDSYANDAHKIAEFKLLPGTESGLNLALHLNDDKKNIISKVGEFPVSEYCQGDKILNCKMPINNESYMKAATLGIAAYKVPGQLLAVQDGVSDWDGHRALFSIDADPASCCGK